MWWKPRVLSRHSGVQELISFLRNFSAEPICFVLWSFVNILGTQRAHNFLYPIFCHSFMNCGLRHFGNGVMQLSYCHASICANFSFNFLKNVFRDQRWPTAPLFVLNISPSFGQFTAPLRHILPIQNVTINRQQFVCQFPLDVHVLRWEIVWRNAPRIWRDFGSVLPFQTRLTHTKSVLLLSNEHGSQVKDHCRRQCCHNKHNIFLIALHVMYLYFPDTPRKKKYRTKLL